MVIILALPISATGFFFVFVFFKFINSCVDGEVGSGRQVISLKLTISDIHLTRLTLLKIFLVLSSFSVQLLGCHIS